MDRIDRLQAQLDTLAQQTAHWQQQTRRQGRQLRWWRGLAGWLLVLVVLTWALPSGTAQEDTVASSGKEQKGLEQRVAALESLLKHFSRKGNEVTITGANLHLVNGLGQTGCGTEEEPIQDCPNGLGNLIVGYNELRDEVQIGPNVRTGSHNVVVGTEHNFSRFGGLVVGFQNTISGDFAVVSGGAQNTASGSGSSVSGGASSTASGGASSVSGGLGNRASGGLSSVTGGDGNTASGDESSVGGGAQNTASEFLAVVNGGQLNTASGASSTVSGGVSNTASGFLSVVSGGEGNTASGVNATVSGGQNRTAAGDFDWVAGSLLEED